MSLPLEVVEAHKNLIGGWSNADDTIFFMFTDPQKNWDKQVMTYKISNTLINVGYFLTCVPLSNNRFILHKVIPTRPFEHGNLILEFISDDTIELRYYEDYIFTLSKMSGGFEDVFKS